MEELKKVKVNADHLDQLNNLFNGVIDRNAPKNILKWARSMSKYYLDDLIQLDTQPTLFQGQYPVQVIYYNLEQGDDGDMPHIRDCEPDQVIFQIRFNTKYNQTGLSLEDNLHEIFVLIMDIMLSDCTGCCDALDYINITEAGIIASGNVSSIYHS